MTIFAIGFPAREDLFNLKFKEGQSHGLLVDAIVKEPCPPDGSDPLCFDFPSPMPPRKSSGDVESVIPRITDDELDVIKEWIELKLPQFEE